MAIRQNDSRVREVAARVTGTPIGQIFVEPGQESGWVLINMPDTMRWESEDRQRMQREVAAEIGVRKVVFT